MRRALRNTARHPNMQTWLPDSFLTLIANAIYSRSDSHSAQAVCGRHCLSIKQATTTRAYRLNSAVLAIVPICTRFGQSSGHVQSRISNLLPQPVMLSSMYADSLQFRGYAHAAWHQLRMLHGDQADVWPLHVCLSECARPSTQPMSMLPFACTVKPLCKHTL